MPMVTVAHVAGIFVSAFLLFLIQPMVARMLLPRFGGSPAVWNTCLLFFQAMLLAGYLYSHLVVRRLSTRALVAVHAVVLLLPLALLPPLVGARWIPAPDAWPVPMLLGALAATVGLPFFALSTNGTLAQHWLLRHGREPYFLYSASNTGSLLALLCYPFVVEPALGLRGQARLFAGGYLAFVAITAVLMVLAVRRPDRPAAIAGAAPAAGRSPLPSLSRCLGWAFRAMVASSLLLAVTLRITVDIGALPLLWVIPLSVYLLTFIIAFLPRFPYPRRILEILTMSFVTVGFAAAEGEIAFTPVMIVCMGVLFLGCWICHADLAGDRPSPEHLTTFYLWISVGGVLGGLFGNLAAPMMFDSIAEFPLTLALLAIVLVTGDGTAPPFRDAVRRRGTLAIGALMGVAFAAAALAIAGKVDLDPRFPVMTVMVLGMALWRRNKGLFAIAAALTSVFVSSAAFHGGLLLESERSFFGVLRVKEKDGERFMLHGTTIHGSQRVAPFSDAPRFYYHPAGPLAAAVRSAGDTERIALVGLGSGALAVYTRAGQTITYYEIDPIVEPMARRWFTFLESSPAKVAHVTGDARLTLDRVPDGSIDLLVVDAFSSDAVPVHLLTREAVEMYARKLAPKGRIVAHVSNRHLDLAPLLGAAAEHAGLVTRQWRFAPTREQAGTGASVCHAVMLARTEEDLAAIEGPWVPLVPAAKDWTDDHSSLLDALK